MHINALLNMLYKQYLVCNLSLNWNMIKQINKKKLTISLHAEWRLAVALSN